MPINLAGDFDGRTGGDKPLPYMYADKKSRPNNWRCQRSVTFTKEL